MATKTAKSKPSPVCSAHGRTLRKRGSSDSARVLASDCKVAAHKRTKRKKASSKKKR